MAPPPNQLDGARVIMWAEVSETRPTGGTRHWKDGKVMGPAAGLAICQYDDDSQFYLFYCDQEWAVCTDTCHSSLELAREQAEFEYEGVHGVWQRAT